MIVGDFIKTLFIYACAYLLPATAYADVKNCQGENYENIEFKALVNNIQLGYTALNNTEVFSCIVRVINLEDDKKPEITLLPTLTEPENSIVLCNYFYTIYNVDRPISVRACKEISTGYYYLRLIGFLNIT